MKKLTNKTLSIYLLGMFIFLFLKCSSVASATKPKVYFELL